jgi:hypothetical protein
VLGSAIGGLPFLLTHPVVFRSIENTLTRRSGLCVRFYKTLPLPEGVVKGVSGRSKDAHHQALKRDVLSKSQRHDFNSCLSSKALSSTVASNDEQQIPPASLRSRVGMTKWQAESTIGGGSEFPQPVNSCPFHALLPSRSPLSSSAQLWSQRLKPAQFSCRCGASEDAP